MRIVAGQFHAPTPSCGPVTIRATTPRMEAKIGIERWRRHYNEERPHMSLGDLTPPAEFKKQMGTTHEERA